MNIKSLIPRPRSAAERQLRRELATYDTPSAIADLMATVDAQEGPEAEMIRSILCQNLREANRPAALIH
jgi:hypothetical protein